MAPAEVLTAPVALNVTDQVSDVQLSRYAELIYVRTGIRVSPQKKALLSNRLRRRLRSTGIAGFEDYYRRLKSLPPHDPEWDAFLQEITTHETYLFRDQPQWDWLRKTYLPACAAAAKSRDGQPRLRIWSAACSTGDEAFTVACCLAATLLDYTRWKIQIVGTDIGVGAVQQAQTGVFGERAMRLVPSTYRKSYFTKARDGELWQARPALTAMVSFRQHNLLDPLPEQAFDLVFLKNVLIYFDRPSKQRVLTHVKRLVRPGGVLIAGVAEGVADLIGDFTRLDAWLYRRPESSMSVRDRSVGTESVAVAGR